MDGSTTVSRATFSAPRRAPINLATAAVSSSFRVAATVALTTAAPSLTQRLTTSGFTCRPCRLFSMKESFSSFILLSITSISPAFRRRDCLRHKTARLQPAAKPEIQSLKKTLDYLFKTLSAVLAIRAWSSAPVSFSETTLPAISVAREITSVRTSSIACCFSCSICSRAVAMSCSFSS